MVLVTGNRFSLQNGRYDISGDYDNGVNNSHFIVDKEYIYFYADKNSSDITETFVYDISTSTTTDASYISTSTTPPTRALTVHNSNNTMDISNGTTTSLHTYDPFIYIEDGVYSISNEYFSTTNMDMSVNGTEVQLYGDACMNNIIDPFIMSYDLTNSNSTIATYSFTDTTPDPDVTYTVTISSSSNDISFNDSFTDISNIITSGGDISYNSLF